MTLLRMVVVAIKKCFRIFDRKLITKRCLREVKLLQHFNGHPHIVGLLDMDIVDYSLFNEIYLILECCDTTMSDVIHSNVELEPVHYRWFMYQIFSALHYIHSANVSLLMYDVPLDSPMSSV
jgi:mitogen-activated protein kinase 7